MEHQRALLDDQVYTQRADTAARQREAQHARATEEQAQRAFQEAVEREVERRLRLATPPHFGRPKVAWT